LPNTFVAGWLYNVHAGAENILLLWRVVINIRLSVCHTRDTRKRQGCRGYEILHPYPQISVTVALYIYIVHDIDSHSIDIDTIFGK